MLSFETYCTVQCLSFICGIHLLLEDHCFFLVHATDFWFRDFEIEQYFICCTNSPILFCHLGLQKKGKDSSFWFTLGTP
jgi:hypothetical protein